MELSKGHKWLVLNFFYKILNEIYGAGVKLGPPER